MSYSEVSEHIEKVGFDKAFDEIYLQYKKSKEEFEIKEFEYLKAKSDMESDMYAAKMYVQRACNAKIGNKEGQFHIIRKVVNNEYVYFKSNGNEYSIGYETLSNFDTV